MWVVWISVYCCWLDDFVVLLSFRWVLYLMVIYLILCLFACDLCLLSCFVYAWVCLVFLKFLVYMFVFDGLCVVNFVCLRECRLGFVALHRYWLLFVTTCRVYACLLVFCYIDLDGGTCRFVLWLFTYEGGVCSDVRFWELCFVYCWLCFALDWSGGLLLWIMVWCFDCIVCELGFGSVSYCDGLLFVCVVRHWLLTWVESVCLFVWQLWCLPFVVSYCFWVFGCAWLVCLFCCF